MSRTVKVVLSEEAAKQYEELNKIVDEEIKKGITNSIHHQLLKSINQKKELLRINPQAGVHIPKKLIPKVYIMISCSVTGKNKSKSRKPEIKFATLLRTHPTF